LKHFIPTRYSRKTTMTLSLPPPIATRITTLLKCKYPIVLPGMSWISTPPLVAAVCNAGGVGILATGPLSAEETRAAIRSIRQQTDQPFGIGATLLMPGAKENVQVALQEQVPILNVSLGKPDWIADQVHAYHGTLISTVTNAKHAAAALQCGADALMVTGHEAAAHGGDVTTLCLVPALASYFPEMPLIAAGGVANGAGLAAVLCLGADAAAMGTRLAVTQESSLSRQAQIAMVESSESQTLYGSNLDGIPARVLSTKRARQLMKSRPSFPTVFYRALQAAQSMNIPLWKVLPGMIWQWDKMYMIAQFGAATKVLTQATIDGDMEHGVQFSGQSVGLVTDIPSVHDLIPRIMREAHETLSRNHDKFNASNVEETVRRRAQ
jgi:enoyl-[acyl-carrier protein] reductase II